MEQLSNLGMSDQEKLNKNPFFQAAYKPTLGQRFLGGLASGLDRFAENKLRQMERQKESDVYYKAGFRPEIADMLVHLRQVDPAHFSDIFKNLGSGAYRQEEPTQNLEPEITKQKESLPSVYQDKEVLKTSGESLGDLRLPKSKTLFGKEDQLLKKDLLDRQKEQRKIQYQEEKELRKLEHEKEKSIEKEIKPKVLSIEKDAKGGKEAKLRLARMKEVINTGNLSNPVFASLISTLKKGVGGSLFGHIGLDLSSLLTKESQEYGKIAADFVKNVKDFFPSRVTDRDLVTFMETIPNLSQTNEGKVAVIHQLETMADMAILKEKGLRHILKSNGNKVTPNLLEEVEEYIKPEMDKLTNKFIKGIQSGEKIAGTRSLPREIIEAPLTAILGVN